MGYLVLARGYLVLHQKFNGEGTEMGAKANKIGEGGSESVGQENDQIAHGGHSLGRYSATDGRSVFTEWQHLSAGTDYFYAPVVSPEAQEGYWRGVAFGHTASTMEKSMHLFVEFLRHHLQITLKKTREYNKMDNKKREDYEKAISIHKKEDMV
ncbi:MAG: hypothetical protein LBD34_02240 [Puniceicoccales bacterium]|nr:hypothetical protein [Puniceicoccales bacterium]